MNLFRFMSAILALCGLIVLLARGSLFWLALAALGALVTEASFLCNLRLYILRALPVLLFCAVLMILELVGHHSVSSLALKAFASYAILVLAVRLMPWTAIIRSVSPQSRFFVPILFLLFVHHFTLILRDETFRTLTAYRLAVPHPFRHGGLKALAFALNSLFRCCLVRAERFYAAQLLRGLAQ